ncbi:MAG: sorbosone dehydrogenase, partial [Planctomycetes bacterium]|nr:sorbosone dehydrogenase [Planctomycetota bacterium]
MISLAFALLLQAAQAEPPPPDPEIERKSFKVAEGFEVNLFAADPLVSKPTQMNFDARGRLWISTSSVYPMVVPGEIPNDRIVILEDTDGDGRADKSTVFAEGLHIPTGIEPGDGGCYVANSTELIHLKDADGDGKADQRRVLLSGFGTEDTHHIIHTFRWGPDGALYFNQSIYIHSHIETPKGTRRLGGAGIWRFRPASLDLEIFTKGMCNPWGHEFDRWGNSFGTDGAGGDGIHYLIPGFTYPHFPGGEKQFPGLNPGQPKYCANETISGRHFPDDWQGDIVTNDFRANRVVRFKISDDGSGFSSKLMPDLITSTDRAFRPIDVRMGPDGALYIADWYNPIINHGEVGFRDPRRDKTHGRIWRVTAKGRPLAPKPKLDGPSSELVEQLKSPEGWTRHFAKRAL